MDTDASSSPGREDERHETLELLSPPSIEEHREDENHPENIENSVNESTATDNTRLPTAQTPTSHPRPAEPSVSDLAAPQPLTNAHPTIWAPCALRYYPWLALSALVIVVLCIGACIVILEVADGQAVSLWKFGPTVYLSILSTTANACLAAAFSEGAVISWWRLALHGSTAQRLSETWSYGTSGMSSIFGLRRIPQLRVHPLVLASVMLTLVLVNGPLLQRAVIVVSHTNNSTIPMTASIAPEIPGDYTATRGGRTDALTPTDDYIAVMQDYSRRTPIKSPFNATCDGSCTATIRAAGLASNICTEFVTPVNYTDSMPDQSSNFTAKEFSGLQVSLAPGGGEIGTPGYQETLLLTVGGPIVEKGGCVGHFVTRWCELHPAVAEYHVAIQNNIVTFTQQIHHPQIIALANVTGLNEQYTTIGGLQATADELFTANFSWLMDPIYGWQYINTNIFALQYLPNLERISLGEDYTDFCPSSFKDPTDDILSAFNEILFRTSIHAASPGTLVNLTLYPLDAGLSLYQQVNVQQNSIHNVFRVIDWALWAAVAVTCLGVAAILPTMWGWWEIGTEVSMDPIETARAFGSPLLWRIRETNSGSKVEEKRSVKTGFLEKCAFWRREGWKKAAGSSDRVGVEPTLQYGEAAGEGKLSSETALSNSALHLGVSDQYKRLEFHVAANALKPRKSERYIR